MSKIIRSAVVNSTRNLGGSKLAIDEGRNEISVSRTLALSTAETNALLEKNESDMAKLVSINESLQQRNQDQKSMIDKLQGELEQLKDTRGKEAFQSGFDEGVVSGKEQYTSLLEGLERARELMISRFDSGVEEVVDSASTIAFASICKIVEVKFVDSEFVTSVVNKVVQEKVGDVRFKLLVSPSQLDIFQHEDALSEIAHRLDPVEIEADSRVKLGGCIVQTDIGNWDARLETQLQSLIDLYQSHATFSGSSSES